MSLLLKQSKAITGNVFVTAFHISNDGDDWRQSRFEAVVSASEGGLAQQEKSVRSADKTSSKDSAPAEFANIEEIRTGELFVRVDVQQCVGWLAAFYR